MITYTQGNLLEAQTDALVNTVNTVGVMGKGIALMFKERFPKNMLMYSKACKKNEVEIGKMFITETHELMGPRWIINFPTKKHWREKSQMQWIITGLNDLNKFIKQNNIKSIAIPPLGAGNGGLKWEEVKIHIEHILSDLSDTNIIVYEPIAEYQNVAKQKGVEKLTPARALIAELVRRYLILGMECSLLEIQKLAWFLERTIEAQNLQNPLNLNFIASNYGPYANKLSHLLDGLDGSYLKSSKRIGDCSPLDTIWFNDAKQEQVALYLKIEAKQYLPALEQTSKLIDGFESPFGMELLSTVDWLLSKENVKNDIESVSNGIRHWPAGEIWAKRKENLFNSDKLILALKRFEEIPLSTHH